MIALKQDFPDEFADRYGHIVPRLAETVGHLDVYQRTAPWIVPRQDRAYPAIERAALRHVPGLQRLYRLGVFLARETYVPAFTAAPDIAKPAELLARGNIRKGISDPELRERYGHVLVAMREDWAVMTRQFPRELNLVGMHGSLTPDEMLVPLFID